MRALPAIGLLALALLLGCADEPLTTQQGCSGGELFREIAFFDPPGELLLIVEPELAERLRPRLLALLRAFATGEVDDVPGKDVWAASTARVGAVSIQAAEGVALEQRCLEAGNDPSHCFHSPLPFVRYHGAPYGFADDPDAFAEQVLCLLGPGADGCASAPEPDEPPFDSVPLQVWLITDQDSCDPFGGEQGCDPQLNALVGTWRGNRMWGSGWWWPTLIAGFPADLTTVNAFHGVDDDRSRYLRQIASDPRMLAPRGADACEGRGELSAEPARELLRTFGDTGDGDMSICADDYRPVLEMTSCGGFFDGATWDLDPEQLARDADGRADCDFDEVLPAKGPIMHCAQLADFGRSAEPVAMDHGREVCRLDQLTPSDGAAGNGYGWYLADASDRESVQPEPLPTCFGIILGNGLTPVYAHGTARVPNSSVRFRCATAATPSGQPRCPATDAGPSD